MITGAHAIIYSKDADRDRAFFKDVLGSTHVDVGGGWLIFGLPPAEVAVHPGASNGVHELYLMVDDIEAFVRAMRTKKLECSEIANRGWGLLTNVTLPGGGKLGVYQPRHARPAPMGAKPKAKAAPEKAAAKAATGKGAAKRTATKKPSPNEVSAKRPPPEKTRAKKASAKRAAATPRPRARAR
ncbi:MAG TPA: hypothetical protein VL400_16910 [Polyangiaceae bacterium]|jgi:hypothetical protein|nr:hypothetical protein [Polyangiaceae bacterium]